MPSPFPGMDPWLERPAIFPDLHFRFIARLADVINDDLPAPYYTAVANRVWIDLSKRHIEPDVRKKANPPRKGRTATADLQPVLDECYDRGKYERRVHYRTQKPRPPLRKEQKAWAEKILRARGI